MKIKKVLKLFCDVKRDPDCTFFASFKKLLEEHEAKKKPKIIMCPNCFFAFRKQLGKTQDESGNKPEGFEIYNKPGFKILLQLEIEYDKTPECQSDYENLIYKIIHYFENNIIIPKTEKINFKHLDKVRISKIIQ